MSTITIDNRFWRLAGISSTLTEEAISKSVIDDISKKLVSKSCDLAYKKNGEVDTDGVRHFLNDVIDDFVKEIKAHIKDKKLDEVQSDDDDDDEPDLRY